MAALLSARCRAGSRVAKGVHGQLLAGLAGWIVPFSKAGGGIETVTIRPELGAMLDVYRHFGGVNDVFDKGVPPPNRFATRMPPDRTARASDVDDLAAVGAVSPATAFQPVLSPAGQRETAETLIAESDGRVAGYAIVLFARAAASPGSIPSRPAPISAAAASRPQPDRPGLAFEHDRSAPEVRQDNSRAIHITSRAVIARSAANRAITKTAPRRCAERPCAATFRGYPVPFYQRTCVHHSPCCLMMAMANFDSGLCRTRSWKSASGAVDDRVHDVGAGRLRASVSPSPGTSGLGGSLRVVLRRAVPTVHCAANKPASWNLNQTFCRELASR
jgi:hypothetical protein